jgi:hypothetical protein
MRIYFAVSARAAPDFRNSLFLAEICLKKACFAPQGFLDLFDNHTPPKRPRCYGAPTALVRTDIRSDGCVAYVLYAGAPIQWAHPTFADILIVGVHYISSHNVVTFKAYLNRQDAVEHEIK